MYDVRVEVDAACCCILNSEVHEVSQQATHGSAVKNEKTAIFCFSVSGIYRKMSSDSQASDGMIKIRSDSTEVSTFWTSVQI